MNRFHVNVETALIPYRAELFCDNQLLASTAITAPTVELKAGVVTTELGEAPTLTGAEHITLQQGDAFNPLDGIQAFDAEDGDITASIVVSGSVDTQTPGDYVLTYSVTDSEGQTVSVTRIVTVEASAVCIANWEKKATYVGGDKVSHQAPSGWPVGGPKVKSRVPRVNGAYGNKQTTPPAVHLIPRSRTLLLLFQVNTQITRQVLPIRPGILSGRTTKSFTSVSRGQIQAGAATQAMSRVAHHTGRMPG